MSTGKSANKKPARGLVIINTGDGKGKTTAALGLMMRAWGHDMKVIMLQFIKNSKANFGEHRAARKIGLEIIPMGAGFTTGGKNIEKNKRLSVQLWETAREKINSGDYRLIVLDELTYPLQYDWLSTGDIIETLKQRPEGVNVVITGRNAPQELIDFADLVSEIQAVKHHLEQGIKAQAGVEF